MKKSIYAIIIVLLAGVVLYQSHVIAKTKNEGKQAENSGFMAQGNVPADLDKLADEIDKKIVKDEAETAKIFDKYFNSDFFKASAEPFKQIQESRDRMMNKFEKETQSVFGKSWDNWYKQKFELSGITSSVNDTKDSVVMSFKMPDVDNRSIKVDINDKRIDMEYDSKKTEESKKKNSESYSSAQEHVTKILPVPANVDASKAKIDAKQDGITITFPKKMPKKG